MTKVLIARFPFGNQECPDSVDWLVKTVLEMKADPRIGEVLHMRVDDTPITMGRNRVLKAALEQKADFVLMLDSDMKPDLPEPGMRPFWKTAFNFALEHRGSRGPCVVGAPYCGPPPVENVYVFRWATHESQNPNADMHLVQYSREEAAFRMGFEEVAALPTGLFLLDVSSLDALSPPWFDYEWEDEPYRTAKASTEDVYFSRNLSLAGVPNYVLWDAWAGHWKKKCVGRPSLLTPDAVASQLKEALGRPNANQRLVMVGEGNGAEPE